MSECNLFLVSEGWRHMMNKSRAKREAVYLRNENGGIDDEIGVISCAAQRNQSFFKVGLFSGMWHGLVEV